MLDPSEPMNNRPRERKNVDDTDAKLKKTIKTAQVLEAIETIRAHYPEEVWPNEGDSVDCKGAKMARLTCDNIASLIRLIAK